MGHRSPGALFYSELNGNIGVKSKECLGTCRHFQLISARFQVLMWVLSITFWCSPCIFNEENKRKRRRKEEKKQRRKEKKAESLWKTLFYNQKCFYTWKSNSVEAARFAALPLGRKSEKFLFLHFLKSITFLNFFGLQFSPSSFCVFSTYFQNMLNRSKCIWTHKLWLSSNFWGPFQGLPFNTCENYGLASWWHVNLSISSTFQALIFNV